MERNSKKVYTGKVSSNKMDKTITVLIEGTKIHPIYKKRVTVSNKLKAHDENNQAQIGDVVKIMETRPLSKHKRFRLIEIVEKSEK